MKKIIRLAENDLHRIIRQSINSVLKEATDPSTDGALEYQGGPNYQNYIKARSNWFLKNRANGKDTGDLGMTFNSKNHDHSSKIYRNDSWIDTSTHGAPKEVTIRFEIENPLVAAINKIEELGEKMNLSMGEHGFLREIEDDINAILKKLYNYETEENGKRL